MRPVKTRAARSGAGLFPMYVETDPEDAAWSAFFEFARGVAARALAWETSIG
jgi:hypothetical protein